SGDCLVVYFEDNGCGIPHQEKENIFIRKYFKNTGYGLFLSKEILSITGILFKEIGKPGKGARFEILVPAKKYRKVSLR
ncbi:MAG: ATP-binding protein, partial [Methanoregulaceae archaeon]|nr:ATP-binding protein [Methanoregulaceae archaeon]